MGTERATPLSQSARGCRMTGQDAFWASRADSFCSTCGLWQEWMSHVRVRTASFDGVALKLSCSLTARPCWSCHPAAVLDGILIYGTL
jgi:hypothetical protein